MDWWVDAPPTAPMPLWAIFVIVIGAAIIAARAAHLSTR